MGKQTSITVVMVNFNGLKYLKRTVPSILDLNYPNFEFIVVDNGSEDGSVESLKKFKKVSLLETSKKGDKNYACNYAVKKAKGEYVLLLDNDILLQDSNLLSNLEKLKSPGKIIQPLIVNKGENKTEFYGIFFTFYGPSLQKKEVLVSDILSYEKEEIPIGAPYAGAYFFHRKTWLEIGGYDEIQPFALDDFDIGPRAWIMGLKCFLYTKSSVLHLGIKSRLEREVLVRRFKLRFSGLGISLLKNYSFCNILKTFPFFFLIQFIQAFRYSFMKKDVRIFLAYCSSMIFFFRKIPYSLKKRKEIQSKRTLSDKTFLSLRLPL